MKIFTKPISAKTMYQKIALGYDSNKLSNDELITTYQYAMLSNYQFKYGLFPDANDNSNLAARMSVTDLIIQLRSELEKRELVELAENYSIEFRKDATGLIVDLTGKPINSTNS
jgi:hypothetical protein